MGSVCFISRRASRWSDRGNLFPMSNRVTPEPTENVELMDSNNRKARTGHTTGYSSAPDHRADVIGGEYMERGDSSTVSLDY